MTSYILLLSTTAASVTLFQLHTHKKGGHTEEEKKVGCVQLPFIASSLKKKVNYVRVKLQVYFVDKLCLCGVGCK